MTEGLHYNHGLSEHIKHLFAWSLWVTAMKKLLLHQHRLQLLLLHQLLLLLLQKLLPLLLALLMLPKWLLTQLLALPRLLLPSNQRSLTKKGHLRVAFFIGKPTISWVWQVNLLDRPCTFAGQLAHNGSHYETFYIDCASSIS
jgi:hypothetical protein